MNKKGMQQNVLGAIAVIGVLLIAGFSGGFAWISEKIDGISEGTGSTASIVNTCDSTTTPSFTISAFDARNVGTALTEATNLYREQGKTTWSTFTAGTGFAAEVGKKYEVAMGITTTDFTDNSYGPYFVTEEIPCSETPSVEKPLYQDEVETSLSSVFYDSDGDAGPETFVAGQSQTVSLKLITGTDEFFGNPTIPSTNAQSLTGQRAAYPNVICMDLNSTTWDRPESVSFNGVEMRSVPQPQRHAAVAGHTTYCYEAPIVDDTSMESMRYQMRLNADDSNAPSEDDTISIYAANYFINADDGKVYFGVENEEGVAVGTDAPDTVTADFTA